jgi:tetratricopeptide (TPR) repeat protein
LEVAAIPPIKDRMPPFLSRISGGAALAALTGCLAATAVLAWEDRLARAGSPQALETAIRLAPEDARNYAALASLGGSDRTRLLELATRTSHLDSMAWIQIGLDAELRGEGSRAERCLLEAARVDKTYLPRWSLASFYFRTNNPGKFWPWLREAARMAYGDPRALAHLAWNMAEDAPEGLAALGERPPVLESYVSLLLDNRRLGPAETAADKLIERGGKESAGAVLIYCDRFLEAGRPEAALRLWNRLAAAGLISARPLDPERGPHLTNGDFATGILNRGFDWRMPHVAGAKMAWFPARGELGFSFSGEQPEDCMLMLERVPLAPNRSWRLAFEYRSEGMAADTGLRWRTIGAEWPAPASESWREAVFEFRTPREGIVVPLVLAYQRVPGTVRTEGSFWVRRVRLEAAAP